MTLISIASQKNKPTNITMKEVNKFLEYMATYPYASIRYSKYDMILNIHADTPYLENLRGAQDWMVSTSSKFYRKPVNQSF